MAKLGTRSLVLRVGATPTDYTGSVSKVVVTAGESDSDFTTFADAAAGGAREYYLEMTLAQDPATNSLWRLMWDSPGTDVAAEVWPNGRPVSGTASATQPKFTGTVTVAEPDGDLLGGEADKSNTKVFVSEVKWKWLSKPTMATS